MVPRFIYCDFRNKLDELAGEIERLEDTFEFSPLEDLDVILSRVLDALEDTSAEISVASDTEGAIHLSDDQLRASLRYVCGHHSFAKKQVYLNWKRNIQRSKISFLHGGAQ